MGRKPLLIVGSIGMAVGAFCVAFCDEFQVGGILPVLSIIVYAAFYDVMGTYLLGVDCRDISEYYPRQGSGYRCSFPVDIQLSGLFHFSCHV